MVAVRDHRNDCSDAVFDMNTTYSFCVRSRITAIESDDGSEDGDSEISIREFPNSVSASDGKYTCMRLGLTE